MSATRCRILVDGMVQGVGFRPFVFNLAESLRLSGFVTNTSDGVVIEVQGDQAALERFTARLRDECPPLARILGVSVKEQAPLTEAVTFVIRPSPDSTGTATLIPPDVATCTDCLREIRDPHDRRHGYAFTNCTNCGPRWTIIQRIPYDRPFTSMARFEMCPDCRREYEDPRNRRFHAQPNACPVCGPRLWLEGGDKSGDKSGAVDGDALTCAASLLAAGRILAIKGLGGFHLAVRADNQEAVARLRERKRREAKPLAVMTNSIAGCRELCEVSVAEAEALASPQAPIVLLERRPDAPVATAMASAGASAGAPMVGSEGASAGAPAVATAVAAGHRRLGVMLPYTPLHHLLFDALASHGVRTLVMTSGNAGSEPICLDNADARTRLRGIADAWLLHDRDIVRRADDSVLQILSADEKPLFFRRSRGYAPVPVLLQTHREGPDVLAVGPELKNTICVLKEDRAFLSPHVGDLENLRTNEFFTETVATLTDLLECGPRYIAHDRHPGYFSTQWARQRAAGDPGLELIPVQHHHAHLAAVLAEHGHPGPAVGVILDGTGYGTDGTIWGGEILVGDAAGFTRAAHLETVPLPGGDAAVRQPWRTAVSWLERAFSPDPAAWPALPFLDRQPVASILEMIAKGVNCPMTSSCGRLFDAVAALTGRWDVAAYEAQAAMEFMALTTTDEASSSRPFDLKAPALDGEVIPVAPLVRACSLALTGGASAAEVSARFHRTLGDRLCEATIHTARATGIGTVALGGGVFQNEILLTLMLRALDAAGLEVLRPVDLPPGDGAVALGQAVVARVLIAGAGDRMRS